LACSRTPEFIRRSLIKQISLPDNIIQCVPLATELDNEDIATKFEQRYVRCVRNEEECVCGAPNCCDTEQRSAGQAASLFRA
jgi:hypothetical protein